MSIKMGLLKELEYEAVNTKKMLEKVPFEKFSWKPHEKSMNLGRLAVHVAELPNWTVLIVKEHELNLGTAAYKPAVVTSNAELLQVFEKNLTDAKQALESATEESLDEMWALKNHDHVIFTLPRKAVLRSMVLNHIVHHRAQLSVYLRLLDIPIPGMYGPSADER